MNKTLIVSDHILSQALENYGLSPEQSEELIESLESLTTKGKGCFMPVTFVGCTETNIQIMPAYLEADETEE